MNPVPNATISTERSGGSHDGISKNTSPRPIRTVLTEEMLARFASRASSYDRENRFFREDFEELRESSTSCCPFLRSSVAPA